MKNTPVVPVILEDTSEKSDQSTMESSPVLLAEEEDGFLDDPNPPNHFALAEAFYDGLLLAKNYGLEVEYTQWFLDDILGLGMPEDKLKKVKESVNYALYEWDL